MEFSIKRRTPLPLMAIISIHFFTPLFSFAIESYIYETIMIGSTTANCSRKVREIEFRSWER